MVVDVVIEQDKDRWFAMSHYEVDYFCEGLTLSEVINNYLTGFDRTLQANDSIAAFVLVPPPASSILARKDKLHRIVTRRVLHLPSESMFNVEFRFWLATVLLDGGETKLVSDPVPDEPPANVAAKPEQVTNNDLLQMLVATMRAALVTRSVEQLDTALALLVRYSRLLPIPRQREIVAEIHAALAKYDRQWEADSAPLSAEELEKREKLGRTFFWRKVKRVRDSSYWLGDEQRHRQWADFADALAADLSR